MFFIDLFARAQCSTLFLHFDGTAGRVYPEQVGTGIAEITFLSVDHPAFKRLALFPLAHLFVRHVGNVFADIVFHLGFGQAEIRQQSLMQVVVPVIRLGLLPGGAGGDADDIITI